MSKIFRHHNCDVIQVPGGFRVRETRTQKVFCVQLKIHFGKRGTGPCSCGNAAADVPIFRCRHQGAAFALISQQWLDSLVRRGLFRHPERLTLEFERKQRRLLHAFSRAMRAGPPPCPHCGRTITAEDLATVAQKGTERVGFGDNRFGSATSVEPPGQENGSNPLPGVSAKKVVFPSQAISFARNDGSWVRPWRIALGKFKKDWWKGALS